jgi:PBSX family phage terminase large subunit
MTLAGVMFDEAALMPRSFVEQALARCSVTGSKFWFNCNPENPYHWFYTEWIQKCREKNMLYLHFTMADNPSLSPKIISRYRSLYTGTFYQRFIEGKWVASQGLVYPEMALSESFCALPGGELEEFFVSCDYGTVNPTSMGLWGRQAQVWYRIDEYYHDSRREGFQLTDEEYYAKLLQLTANREISAVIVDPSAASFIRTISANGKFKVIRAKNDVIDGIRLTAEYLRQGKVRICLSCAEAKREFSLYSWQSGGCKDAPKKEHDHAMDDIRYFVSTVAAQSAIDEPIAIAASRALRLKRPG